MAIKDDTRARAPRGTKNVTQAFFAALDEIAEGQQKAVGTAALASIRDDLKARRVKAKEAAAKTKAKAPAKAKAAATRKVKAATKRAPAGRKQTVTKKAPARKAAPIKAARRKAPTKAASPALPDAASE